MSALEYILLAVVGLWLLGVIVGWLAEAFEFLADIFEPVLEFIGEFPGLAMDLAESIVSFVRDLASSGGADGVAANDPPDSVPASTTAPGPAAAPTPDGTPVPAAVDQGTAAATPAAQPADAATSEVAADPQVVFCGACGLRVDPADSFCASCGSAQPV